MPDATPMSDGITTTGELKQLVREFVDERDWGKYHNAKDVAIAINVEAGELLELFEWVREDEIPALLGQPEKRRSIGEELADVFMLCLNLSSVMGLDVAQAIGRKLEKNRAKYPAHLVRGNYRKYSELHAEFREKERHGSAD